VIDFFDRFDGDTFTNYCKKKPIKKSKKGEKPWSSGEGRWLMTNRSWVQTPAPYTGWM
jgi:hypothetical protein